MVRILTLVLISFEILSFSTQEKYVIKQTTILPVVLLSIKSVFYQDLTMLNLDSHSFCLKIIECLLYSITEVCELWPTTH